MAGKIGIKNGRGAKGRSGRKSAYAERANAELLEKMFFGQLSKSEVMEKLASGKYSIKDIFVSKGFIGNEKVMLAIFNKLYPDGLKLSGDKKNPVILEWEEKNAIEAIKNIFN